MMKSLLAALAVLASAAPASAQVPRTISYQGVLADNLGSPIADGNYSLIVRLYDAAAAGSLLYTETHPAVAVAGGGFNVLIGGVTPLTIDFDKPLWLSLQVGADPEMSPRVPLASSPYTLGLSLPFDGTANGTGAAFTVRNSSGPALEAEGRVEVYAAGGTSPVVTAAPLTTYGGQITARDEANVGVVRLEPDLTGTGGFLSVHRSSSSMGFSVNGNDGTEEPIVSVFGSVRSAVFDMSQSGNPAVALPSSCISSLEEWNEPGVAEVFLNLSIQIGLGVTSVATRTITVPEDGYVIAMATGSIELGHVNGGDSRVIYGINDVNTAFAASSAVTGVPSGAPTGSYRMATPWNGVWPVTAGSHTFYLLAQRVGAANGAVLNDPTITLIYVATAYGTVTGNLLAGTGGELGKMPSGPLTQGDIEMEKAESAEFDRARMQRELDLVREQVEALRQRLENDPNVAAAAGK